MKKLIIFFLCLTLICSLTACMSPFNRIGISQVVPEQDQQNSFIGGGSQNGDPHRITVDEDGNLILEDGTIIGNIYTGVDEGLLEHIYSSEEGTFLNGDIDINAFLSSVPVTPSDPDIQEHFHVWAQATCSKPKTCYNCGATEGNPLPHDWWEATCLEPMTCSRCGITQGSLGSHIAGIQPNCEQRAICVYCGQGFGDYGPHSWINATCTDPRICCICHITEGSAAGHSMSGGQCTVCGYTESVSTTVKDMVTNVYPISIQGGSITSASYSVQGSDLHITVHGKCATPSGNVTFGWRVYTSSFSQVALGDSTVSNLSQGMSFVTTVVVSGITPGKFYQVSLGLPNI